MFGGAADHVLFQEPVFATYEAGNLKTEAEMRPLKTLICAKCGRQLPSHSDF